MKGSDLIVAWESHNADGLTEYQITFYGPSIYKPNTQNETEDWQAKVFKQKV